MSGTPAQYAAASAAMHKRANALISTLPWFEQSPATNFLNGKMMDEFAKIAVDAALAVPIPPAKPTVASNVGQPPGAKSAV